MWKVSSEYFFRNIFNVYLFIYFNERRNFDTNWNKSNFSSSSWKSIFFFLHLATVCKILLRFSEFEQTKISLPIVKSKPWFPAPKPLWRHLAFFQVGYRKLRMFGSHAPRCYATLREYHPLVLHPAFLPLPGNQRSLSSSQGESYLHKLLYFGDLQVITSVRQD